MHFSRHEKNVKTENTEPQRIVAILCTYHTAQVAQVVSLHWVTQEPGLGSTTEHQEIAVACIASLSKA